MPVHNWCILLGPSKKLTMVYDMKKSVNGGLHIQFSHGSELLFSVDLRQLYRAKKNQKNKQTKTF